MSVLLSICIPTYNRPKMLKRLYDSFLHNALMKYGSQIEIIVCDNSDEKEAKLNQTIVGNRVGYYKNGTNLGFGGNVIQCTRKANGTFIWIISDDDWIDWCGFEQIMTYLPKAEKNNIDCLMLPYYFDNLFNEKVVSNLHTSWNVKKDVLIIDFIKHLNQLPFVFFPTAVLRLNKKRLEWIEKTYAGNYLIQIPLYLSMLEPTSKMHFLDTPVIRIHKSATDGKFYMVPTYNYRADVILFLKNEYGVDVTELLDKNYREILSWILGLRAGLHSTQVTDKERWYFIRMIINHITPKNILLTIAIILPKIFIRSPFIMYLSFRAARNKKSSDNVIFKTLRNFRTYRTTS